MMMTQNYSAATQSCKKRTLCIKLGPNIGNVIQAIYVKCLLVKCDSISKPAHACETSNGM